MIKTMKPTKIFTHALDDPHPQHRRVHKLIIEAAEEMGISTPVYSFDVWNVVKTKRGLPRLVIDVTDTFKSKVKALKVHTSQHMTITSLMWRLYIKDRYNGWRNRCKYAEVFQKIR